MLHFASGLARGRQLFLRGKLSDWYWQGCWRTRPEIEKQDSPFVILACTDGFSAVSDSRDLLFSLFFRIQTDEMIVQPFPALG